MTDRNDMHRLTKSVSENCDNPPLLPVSSINHISLAVSDCDRSLRFYKRVLGFQEITRPKSFDFDGYWLEKENLALHLIQAQGRGRESKTNPGAIETKSNHISLICDTSIGDVERILNSVGILYKKETWCEEPSGAVLEQVFFHDPDGFLIEVCNCDSFMHLNRCCRARKNESDRDPPQNQDSHDDDSTSTDTSID